jgi:signal transduction histidine kinase/CheY-like chemotaxis protein
VCPPSGPPRHLAIWLSGILAFASLVAAARPVSAQAQEPGWRSFTAADGLKESWVAGISVGRSGSIIISHGEVNELTIFDGYELKHLPSPGTDQKVYEADGARLWSCRSAAVDGAAGIQAQALIDGTWRGWPRPLPRQASVDLRHRCVPLDGDRMLVALPDSLYELAPMSGQWALRREAADLGIGALIGLVMSSDRKPWLVAERGAATADAEGKWKAIRLPPEHLQSMVAGIVADARSVLVTTRPARSAPSTLLVWRDNSWKEVARATTAAEEVRGWPGADGTIWLARVRGRNIGISHLVDGAEVEVKPTRVLYGRLHDIALEPDGEAWLATNLGVARQGALPWRAAETLTGSIGATTVEQDRAGRLYVLFDDRLAVLEQGVWRSHPLPTGSNARLTEPNALVPLVNRMLVYLQGGSSFTFDPATGQFELAPAISEPKRQTRVIGRAGPARAWVSTPRREGGAHLGEFDGHSVQTIFDVPDSQFRNALRCALRRSDGSIWVGSTEGLAVHTKGTFHRLTERDGYTGLGAFSLLEVDGEVWVGDRTSIRAYDGRSWRVLRSGLDSVRSMIRTKDGAVWIASGSLMRYAGGTFVTLSPIEGLPDASIDEIFEDDTGHIWTATSRGLWRHAPETDRDPPRTLLAESRNVVEPDGTLRLAVNAVDKWQLTPSARLMYSWRTGDGPWAPFEATTVLTIPGLSAGRHAMTVRSMDRNFNIESTPAAFDVLVLRRWYREPAFMAMMVVSTLALGLLAWGHLTHHRSLEREVRQRTLELQAANANLRRDIAAREAAEAEARRLEEQLRRSQKLEALGRLSGGIAHDFNNLLTVVMSCCDLLQDELRHQPEAADFVSQIKSAGERAGALTRQLLAFSSCQVVQPTPLNPNAAIRDLVKMLERVIGEHVSLTLELDEHVPSVIADATLIDQILVNLAVNARDAMPSGGTLTIRTSLLPASRRPSHLDLGTTPHVCLAVTDTGTGIPVEIQGRVFDPFYTTKAPGKGTGLGLATVHGIVRQLHGAVDFDSTPGAGTTFRIYLPATPETAANGEQRVAFAPARGGETVLLVEDEDAVRSLTQRMLTQAGYRVEVAASGAEALARIQKGDAIDLVLTDVRLTDMSGLAVAEFARTRGSGTRVLLMSGYAPDADDHDGLEFPPSVFLAKPFTRASLEAKIREVLGQMVRPDGPRV